MIFIQEKDYGFRNASMEEITKCIKDKFVVALDFDGVISNPYELKARYINELGHTITPIESGRENCLKLGIPQRDYEKGSIRAYKEKPNKLPMQIGFKENFSVIRTLKNIFIVIVSSRHDGMLKHLEQYLKFHKIRVDSVINTNNCNKGEQLDFLHPRVFVEDTLSKLIAAKKTSNLDSSCKFIFYRNIHNINEIVKSKGVSETNDWTEVRNLILIEYNKI